MQYKVVVNLKEFFLWMLNFTTLQLELKLGTTDHDIKLIGSHVYSFFSKIQNRTWTWTWIWTLDIRHWIWTSDIGLGHPK
jgi:hypothetical protein